jgi:hypothetical protein
MDTPRAPTRGASWGAVAVIAVATLWVAVAVGQLNSLLGAMHVAGSPAFTISDLAGGPQKAENVLKVWTAHGAEAVPITDQRTDKAAHRKPPDAREIVVLLSRLDTFLLVPLYTMLALLFFLRGTRPIGGLQYLGIGAAAITAIFDIVENFAQRKTIDGWWIPVHEGQVGDVPNGWARTLQIAATCKWVFAGLTVLVVALIATGLTVGWFNDRKGQAKAAAKSIHVVAFQAVIAIAAIVLFNQQGQVADLFRRWQALQAVLSLLALAFAGFALWAVTRRLIVRGTMKGYAGPHERRVKWLIFLGLWAAVGIQLAWHYLADPPGFDPGWGLIVPAVLVTILAVLGLGVRSELPSEGPARGVAAQPATEAREPILPRLLATALVIGFAFALLRASFGYAVYTRQWSWGHAIWLLVAAALGAAAGIALRLLLPTLPPEKDTLVKRVVREPVTWAVLGTLVGIGLLAPKGGDTDIEPVLLITLSALLVVGALRWYVAMGRERLPNVGLDKPLAAFAAFFGVVVPAAIALFAVQLGQSFSVPGVAAAFVAAAVLVAGFIAWGAPWLPMPRALRGLPAFPATMFLLIWFVAAAHFDHDGAFHNARVLTHAPPAVGRTAQEQLGCWLTRRGLEAPTDATAPQDPGCAQPTEPPKQRPVPLIVVASTGGGIRSAYWTATVLDCAFDRRRAPTPKGDPCPQASATDAADRSRSDALFALSGISGGSVGMAEYAAHLSSTAPANDDWVRKALEVDGLSPTGARWLFVEIARSFLQFEGPADRAAVLEGSFEKKWPAGEFGNGLFAVERANPHVPLLLLNSTSVADGCRFNVSVLDANVEPVAGPPTTCRSNTPFDEPPNASGPALARESQAKNTSVLPATRDLSDLLCGDTADLRLSTASLLSARFPFVNPAGRVASRCESGPQRVVHGVDGGYLDTSGASPLVELMTALGPIVAEANADSRNAGRCVIPFMVQIDNGFDDSSPSRAPRRPPELLAPLKTVMAARIARAAEARSAAALMFTRPFAGAQYAGKPIANRYAHFVNEAHPGPGAPFGWAQSRFSQQELVSQLRQRRNRDALAEVRGWFSAIEHGKVTCAP